MKREEGQTADEDGSRGTAFEGTHVGHKELWPRWNEYRNYLSILEGSHVFGLE